MAKQTIYSEKVIINAPIEFVWDVLVDLDQYPQWNPFTVKVDTTLKIGDPVYLHVKMGSKKQRVQKEQVRAVTRPYKLAWGMKIWNDFFLTALREQLLEPCGEGACTYVTSDAFNGILTSLIVKTFGKDIEEGFNAVAYALKERAETMWQKNPNHSYSPIREGLVLEMEAV